MAVPRMTAKKMTVKSVFFFKFFKTLLLFIISGERPGENRREAAFLKHTAKQK